MSFCDTVDSRKLDNPAVSIARPPPWKSKTEQDTLSETEIIAALIFNEKGHEMMNCDKENDVEGNVEDTVHNPKISHSEVLKAV
ncbi:hypothetical protein TNCV_1271951 [Trichonephila clavipes]|nr:hypothetical protein TNCV_1271951 [Trichonephila clavipes]